MTQAPSHTTVLIIGGGPAGLLTSVLLARYGIASVIVEKYGERRGQPKAHAINPRSLEILRQAGVDTTTLRASGANEEDGGLVRFVDSVAGVQLGSIPYERQDKEVLECTPEPLFNIAQPKVEDHLRDVSEKTGLVSLLKPWQWESCIQEDDGSILSAVTNRMTGALSKIRSRYLIGCDGSNARSRNQLGIPFEPLYGHGVSPIHYVSVHIKADFSSLPPGILWFVMNDEKVETFICYDRREEWVFIMNFDPSEIHESEFTEAYSHKALCLQALGRPLPYQVRQITAWSTLPRIAQSYRSATIRNAFLAGDAAHAFPSTGGLGINTGFGDVHNLVWKISAVEKGWVASDAFLDTYTEERRPVAVANSKQSAINQTKIGRLAEALFRGNVDIEARIADPASRREIEAALNDNRDHFDSLNLQIGYVYGSPVDRNCSDFIPEVRPGARLPHAWVERDGRRLSSLDLVDGFSFVLLVSQDFPISTGHSRISVPVTVLRLGQDIFDASGRWTHLLGLDASSTGVVVRPDQHIIGSVGSVDEFVLLITRFLGR
ncbi:hypothetical protein FOQG_09662 [Fusarium oxysporum f. sp. raphani 54005]|uniref:FAD-binding domain-containing protein n=2 Tax=Fusarium oxysporum f. sp. raphani TaxID=96318 RepID=X0BW19_FUSOX|nr:hypothetical protein FOQG_09662 [Fusarium oxysporum f. sp. raphani 54005]KAG7427768.1 Tetracenomycin polyketide synthesis hydroxylase TcmG [Fusarium oxysporum f. sp. raphani]